MTSVWDPIQTLSSLIGFSCAVSQLPKEVLGCSPSMSLKEFEYNCVLGLGTQMQT